MNAKHTPGPWVWTDGNQDGNMPALISAAGVEVCHFGDSTCYYPTEGRAPNEHDMRLMAAAPELLKLLSDFVADFRVTTNEDIRAYVAEARAAIAKALGEHQ